MENVSNRFKGDWILNRSIHDKIILKISQLNGTAWFKHLYQDLNQLKYRKELLFKNIMTIFREYIYLTRK